MAIEAIDHHYEQTLANETPSGFHALDHSMGRLIMAQHPLSTGVERAKLTLQTAFAANLLQSAGNPIQLLEESKQRVANRILSVEPEITSWVLQSMPGKIDPRNFAYLRRIALARVVHTGHEKNVLPTREMYQAAILDDALDFDLETPLGNALKPRVAA